MKPLALAFHQKPTLSIPAIIALIISGLIVSFGIMKYWQLHAMEKQIDEQIATKNTQYSQLKPEQNKLKKIDAQAKQAIDETAMSLMYSWVPLFVALEAAQTEEVAILTIAPNHISHILVLALEAKDRTAMFDYVKQLQINDNLSNVHIINHQILTDVEGQPVQFEIEAKLN